MYRCLYFVLFTLCFFGSTAPGGETVFLDEEEQGVWVRGKRVDPFDDSESYRFVRFEKEKYTLDVVVYLERCTSLFVISLPQSELTPHESEQRADVSDQSYFREEMDPIYVSFNFKHSEREDLKLLDLQYFDLNLVEERKGDLILTDPTPKHSQVIDEMLKAHEIRIKTIAFEHLFNLKADLRTFKEKYEWALDICEDDNALPEEDQSVSQEDFETPIEVRKAVEHGVRTVEIRRRVRLLQQFLLMRR